MSSTEEQEKKERKQQRGRNKQRALPRKRETIRTGTLVPRPKTATSTEALQSSNNDLRRFFYAG